MGYIERTFYIASGLSVVFVFWFLIGLISKAFAYFFMLGWDIW